MLYTHLREICFIYLFIYCLATSKRFLVMGLVRDSWSLNWYEILGDTMVEL